MRGATKHGGSCEDDQSGTRAGCSAAQAYAASPAGVAAINAATSSGGSSGGSSGSSGSVGEGGASATADKASWQGLQVAAYYLRTAELLADGGKMRAQEVVDQVRAALLSGADRDSCYMLRASAYMQVGPLEPDRNQIGTRSEPDRNQIGTRSEPDRNRSNQI